MSLFLALATVPTDPCPQDIPGLGWGASAPHTAQRFRSPRPLGLVKVVSDFWGDSGEVLPNTYVSQGAHAWVFAEPELDPADPKLLGDLVLKTGHVT